MANDAACRRESRRRRILENSEHRLQKITGRSDTIVKVTFGNEEGSLGTQNHTFSRQTTNGPVQLASSAVEFRSSCCNSGSQAKSNYSERQSPLEPEQWNTSSTTSELSQPQDTQIYTPSGFHCFYAARLHLICLAVFVRIMLTVDYGFMFGESLVAPLCVVEVTDILWLHLSKPQLKASRGLLGALLLLSGISTHKAALISGCIQMLEKAMQDACIYLFTFITFHAILEWPKNIQLFSRILDTCWLEGYFMHS